MYLFNKDFFSDRISITTHIMLNINLANNKYVRHQMMHMKIIKIIWNTLYLVLFIALIVMGSHLHSKEALPPMNFYSESLILNRSLSYYSTPKYDPHLCFIEKDSYRKELVSGWTSQNRGQALFLACSRNPLSLDD